MNNWKRNLWILWTTQVISLASFGFGLPFIPLYIQELEVLSPEKLKIMTTILAAAPAATMAIMAPIWGYLADKHGRKLMIMRAMFCAIFIITAMGFVSSVNQLIVLRLLQGLLTGTVTAAVAFVASNTPKKHLTEALGVITSATFIGYSLGPVIGGTFAKLYGYRMSFVSGGILMAIGAFLVLFLVKEDKSTLVTTKKGQHVSMVVKYKNILVPMIMIIMVMLFLLRISRSFFAPYLALFVQQWYPNTNDAAFVTGLLNGLIGLSTAFASMYMGKIASRFNKKKMVTALLSISLIIMLLITQYDHIYQSITPWLTSYTPFRIPSPLWIFTILYMMFFFIIGGVEPLLTSTAAMAVESSDRGALFGFQGLVGSLAWFVAPAIAGPVVYYYSIEHVLWVIPIVIFINVTLSILLRRKKYSV